MRAVVVFESMYGATHAVAEAIAGGLAPLGDVEVVAVADAAEAGIADADLLVVGGPTHMHGLASARSRELAVSAAAKKPELHVEPTAAADPGLREWLATCDGRGRRAAAFDTRLDKPAFLTGAASHGIARRLRHHGYSLVAEPESFRVTNEGALVEGEAARARAFGAELAAHVAD
jgi:Flavodoxin domain